MRSLTRRFSPSRIFAATISIIIVGRMGKCTPAVAIAEGPDARDVGAQLLADVNVSAVIPEHAGLFETQVVSVGSPTDSHEQMGADARRPDCLRSPHRSSLHRPVFRLPCIWH